MNILAIDIGTHTGWAVNSGGERQQGVELLCSKQELKAARAQRTERRCDPRIPRLFWFVRRTIERFGVQCIVFEDVLFVRSIAQAHLWASQRAVLWLAATEHGLLIDCLNTTALKTFATKMPSAKKDRMIAALKKVEPNLDFSRVDDNVCDAIWLWRWATERIKP